MNIIIKIEHLMNSLLFWLGAKFQIFWKKIFPHKAYLYLQGKFQKLHYFIRQKISFVRAKLINVFNKLASFGQKAKKVNYKKIALAPVHKSKKAVATPPSLWIEHCKRIFSPVFKMISTKLSQVRPERMVLAIVLLSFIGLGIMGVFFNSQRIYKSTHTNNLNMRTPASVESFHKKKKPYYNLTQKMVKVDNIKIPTLVEDVNSISNITIDFNVISDNRFISLFIDNHRSEVKDYIIMRFKPIKSSFVIKEEGKDVIKERIQVLLDNYLSAKGIKGSIDDVQIEYIIGT